MFKNYLKIALRNIFKNKTFSAINIFGLTIGLACSLLIFLYVFDELSFDRFHDNYQSIHKLESKYKFNDQFETFLDFPAGVAPILKDEVSGIKDAVRMDRRSRVLFNYQEEQVYEDDLFYTDPSFFDMFAFDLEIGDKDQALVNPYSIIISKEIATKYFGSEDPMDQVMEIENEEYVVTGILAEVPKNTHLYFNMLASFSTIEDEETRWNPFPNYDLYVEIEDGVNIKDINSSILDFLSLNTPESDQSYTEVYSNELADLYLKVLSWTSDGYLKGDIKFVRIFSIIGFLILGIACINFMNLTTARSSLRAKEIGVRKSSGAQKDQIRTQFLMESMLISFISALLSVGFIEFLLPYFNDLVGKDLALNLFSNPIVLFGILAISLFAGLIAGLYPAVVLSQFKPVSVLKGQFRSGKQAIMLRKGLVVVQFVCTIALIVCTLIINGQFDFMQKRGLGVNTDSLLSLRVNDTLFDQYPSFKQELLKNPNIESVTTGALLLGGIRFISFTDEDELKPQNNILKYYETDFDFKDALELNMVAGRYFDENIAADFTSNTVINETAVRQYGWNSPEEAVGKQIEYSEAQFTVIGVSEDFHSMATTHEILPTTMRISDKGVDQILIKVNEEDFKASLDYIKATWSAFNPGLPFEVDFMDEEFARTLLSEENLKTLFSAFATLAIFIACLGLLGLAIFATEQRRKEIGIRKVLGASVNKILVLVSRDFIMLVGVGFILAIPIAWYFMDKWIQNYAYRIEIGPSFFLIAGAIAITLTLATVSFQALKAATTNPVNSLRNDQ